MSEADKERIRAELQDAVYRAVESGLFTPEAVKEEVDYALQDLADG